MRNFVQRRPGAERALPFLGTLLLVAVVLEVALLRLFARAGTYLLEEGTPSWVFSLYSNLVSLGSILFNFSSILAVLLLLVIAYGLWSHFETWHRALAVLVGSVLLMDGLFLFVTPVPALSLAFVMLSAAALGGITIAAWRRAPSRVSAVFVIVVASSFLLVYFFKGVPLLVQLGWAQLGGSVAAFRLGEVLAVCSMIGAFLAFGRGWQPKSLALGIIPSLLLPGLFFGKGDMLPLISTWAFGFTLSLPFAAYLLALWLLTVAALESYRRGSPLVALGLLLLCLGHRSIPITYFNDLTLAGMLLFIGIAFPSRQRPVTERNLYRMVTRPARACGLRGFDPHSLRHYFATRLVERGPTCGRSRSWWATPPWRPLLST